MYLLFVVERAVPRGSSVALSAPPGGFSRHRLSVLPFPLRWCIFFYGGVFSSSGAFSYWLHVREPREPEKGGTATTFLQMPQNGPGQPLDWPSPPPQKKEEKIVSKYIYTILLPIIRATPRPAWMWKMRMY